MQFHRTLIKDFGGFEVSGIKSLEHKWAAPTQVIIGANGYGKTRYMRTCTPLPLPKTQFGSNGYHERLIGHNGRMFKLRSDYANKGLIHTFQIDDGPNLNDGGTSTVQADLVQQYLGYTSTVNSLVFNTLDVASMKPAERKQFFMELLPSTDHFLFYHKTVVSKIKSLTGTIATLTDRVSQLKTQILSTDDYIALQTSVNNQMTESSNLLSSINKLEVILSQLSADNSQPDHVQLLKRAHSLCARYNETSILGLWAGVLDTNSISRISADITINTAKLQQLETDIQKVISDIESKTATINTLSMDVSEAELNSLQQELQSLGTSATTPKWTLDELRHIEEQSSVLLDYVTHVADGTIVAITADEHRSLIADHRSISNQLSDTTIALQNDITALTAVRGKLSDSLQVPGECNVPTCILRLKVNELRDNRANAIAALETTIDKKKELIDRLQSELDIIASKLDTAKQFESLVSTIIPIIKLVKQISRDDLIILLIENPMSLYHHYRSLYTAGVTNLQSNRIQQRISEITSKLSVCATVGVDPIALKAQLEQHDNDLHALQEQYSKCKLHLDYLKNTSLPLANRMLTMKTALSELEHTIKNAHQSYIQHHDYQVVKSIYDFLSTTYKSKLIKLAQDESTLREQTTLKSRLEDELLITISQCEKDLALCKKIEAELSPNYGMPFAHMRRFLNKIFAIANALMAVVFVYPIKINPIEVDTGLTYKFTATINNRYIDDDLSACSSAQVAVMNTCLALAIKKTIGLGDYPFFLDEVGNRFDPQHKTRLIYLLEHIVQGKYASQLFVINHDVVIHGGLSHSDVVALSTINVILPSVYNEHVILDN